MASAKPVGASRDHQ